jgi:single-strand DNA-binding protein
MNSIILKGNLTRDVEIRYTKDGTAVAATGLAVSKKYKTQTGDVKETVMFVDIAVWGRRGEVLNQYFRKGTPILIRGELQLEQWTAQDGSKRSKHTVRVEEFDFIQKKGDETPKTYGGEETYSAPPQQQGQAQQAPAAQQAAPAPQQQAPVQPEIPEIDINEDEIPF